ncbi:2-desacetyl-2-hydroxyethyl bacteriochlorophyllide A dehydrogenase [Haloactinopolyspora alba]|uniref:2-desacetyl-2-hydroxyethyl bacteriochlorophyllide A dehydrogenase n=1 Tax=Haloactinopolyspora alba TaxID=648780 RepID=A0A2P8DRF4_9ACTN|nr:zinc-binding alcohol dehydrogenase [Haloactinopolyspora alba]PSK99798.1 2-desacetyl-2-hydroxyethyl bacteriochlorophyllide A dehydrogenase [Haloactinopolyspora alba]
MAHLVRFTAPREAEVADAEDQLAGPGQVRLETLYSGISAGTELTAYRGSNPYLNSAWDPDRRLFVRGDSSQSYPLDAWGYEEVGRVAAVGEDVEEELVGQLAWGTWGHRSSVVRPAEWVRPRIMPAGSEAITGIFAKIGAIALNAILDADIHVGETVVVFGAGVPGQIAAQLARLNGARVVVVDLVPARRELAGRLGASMVLDPAADDVAERVRAVTGNRGADVVIEMSGSYQALHEAVRTAAYSSRVVAGGFFQGQAAPLLLGEEFHHNRITVVGSQISGVAPALQHRWDELRMSTTVLELEREGRLRLTELITHTIPAAEAPAAFEMLDTAPDAALQVVLEYGGEQ